jgi:hypothetical protein
LQVGCRRPGVALPCDTRPRLSGLREVFGELPFALAQLPELRRQLLDLRGAVVRLRMERLNLLVGRPPFELGVQPGRLLLGAPERAL